jgi:integrase/recombinase XerD
MKNPRRIPEVLEPDERERLLRVLEPTSTLAALRNLAILSLFLDSGLRARELRELKTRQINWKSGKLKVRGKGGVERVVWLSDSILSLLQDWLNHRPSSLTELLFTSLDGQKPLCGRWLRRMVKRVGTLAGFPWFHVHSTRHQFGTDLLRKTKNIYLVQRALGHSNIATTTVYLHLVNDELENAMKGLRDDP